MFVASCAESVLDYTVKRISRRYGTRPGTRKGDVLNIAVAVDTSGCFVGNTLIPMADGSLKRIDEVKAGDLVVSSAFGNDQVVRKCSNVFKKESKKLVEVEMDKGFSFECTPCHKVFVVRPDFDVRKRLHKADKGRRAKYYEMLKKSPVIEVRADALKSGDLVVVTNRTLAMPLPDSRILNTLSEVQSGMYVRQTDIDKVESLKSKGFSLYRQKVAKMGRFDPYMTLRAKDRGLAKNLVIVPKTTSEDFCQLMGYYIGDGHLADATFVVTDEDADRLETYRRLSKSVFGLDGEIKKKIRTRLFVNSKSLVVWMRDNFPSACQRSRNRSIPESWTGLPDNEVGALLRGLFDAEGFVGEHYVAFTNSSNSLVTQIHLLLARLGIESTINPTNTKDRILEGTLIRGGHFWRLSVYGGANLRLFEKMVGFSCQKKSSKLRAVVDNIQNDQNNDSYPYTDRQRLVEVRSVTTKDSKSPVPVYDLEIEGEHNYMANGVVVHNSISDEQLKIFFNEIRWIWKNGAKITVYEADCAVCAT